MMSGRLQVDGCEDKFYESQKMAQDIILKQQRTGIYPCPGAAVVPIEAHWSQRLPLNLPYNPNSHLKTKTTAGRVNHHEASVSILVMGLGSEGIRYSRDTKITVANVHKKLSKDGHTIPKAHIFNCVPLKDRKVDHKHFQTCTGRNYEIFKAVWQHDGIGDIVKRFYKEYNEFNNTRAPGEEFHAAFVDKSGCHRSVATALGLQFWLLNKHPLIDVTIDHKEAEQHRLRFCNGACRFCSDWQGRAQWELALIQKVFRREAVPYSYLPQV